MFASYVRLLRHPNLPRILCALLLTRLATPILAIALLMATVDKYGSYATGGMVVAVHGVTQALCSAVAGRLADRRNPGRVLAGFLAAHACTYVALLTLLAAPVGPPAVLAAASALGLTTPPVSAVLRSAWPRLVDPEVLHTAYAADNMTNELMYVVGPLLVTLSLDVSSAAFAIAVAGISLLTGGTLLLLTPRATRQSIFRRPEQRRVRVGGWATVAGPLTHRPTLAVLAATALTSAGFGSLRLAVVAACASFGAPDAAGLLLGLLAVGALVGAFTYGLRFWAFSDRRMLILLCLVGSALYLVSGHAAGTIVLAALIGLAGFLDGFRTGLEQVMIADRAPDQWRTETFSWLNSFMWTGYALGSAAAGQFAGPSGATGAFMAASVGMAIATVVALAARPARTTATSVPDPGKVPT
ncbi:MFS transporter [Streptomyces californicus]|uniref:MFS transporter n=1 Tax=Streptomyces californicus TaxID=67351 RepID=UPI00379199DD